MRAEFSKATKREAWLRCHDERGEARCESCAEAFWGSVVILYGMTKDRWRWGEFARSGGQIFIGLPPRHAARSPARVPSLEQLRRIHAPPHYRFRRDNDTHRDCTTVWALK